jgi:hypothetical protein
MAGRRRRCHVSETNLFSPQVFDLTVWGRGFPRPRGAEARNASRRRRCCLFTINPYFFVHLPSMNKVQLALSGDASNLKA